MFKIPFLSFFKERESLVIYLFWCVMIACTAILLFMHGALQIKLRFQHQMIQSIEASSPVYSTDQQQIDEKKILDYQKKVRAYQNLIENRILASKLFPFLEQSTAEGIQFSDFDFSGASNEIKVSGEANAMETIARQVQLFEQKKEFIRSVTIANATFTPSQDVRFILTLSLVPKSFSQEYL